MRACTTTSVDITYTHIHIYKTHTHTYTHIYIYTLTYAYAVKKKKMDFQETTVSCIIIYIPRIMSANLNGAMWNDISDDDIYKY